ncbi:MAG: Multidrug resistance protein Stp [Candidatus Anoxychlamydiales bacterium]|nr:Multidrug resistance protein Stp [Candidatus Anoxychlamydiales bacterium]NGX41190.1 Multidrug resistance protein Stp [Candidatus Anoxychlamydiales bacterium]HEU64982.1 DHA2 family efflux MFS transporter permease subunit [Chlamydiota bacterium]
MLHRLSDRQRKWLGFISVVSCVALIFTDQSILPVAIPTIQRDLGATSYLSQWMINSYLLSMAVFILAAGRLGDIVGFRRIFLLGLTIFLFASLFCAISMNSIWLITFRFVQGIGAAFMIPSSYNILLDLFPANKRGLVVGINTAVGSFFLALAPYIGGLFTQYLTWRWVFWINIPICFIGQIFGILAIGKPEVCSEKFDFKGFFLFAITMITIILAFMQAKSWGFLSPAIILLFIFAIVFFLFFIVVTKKAKHPFLDFSLFKNKLFSVVSLIIFLELFATGAIIFWAIYFQYLLNFSPSKAGFAMLISSIPIIFMAPVGGMLMDKYTVKVPTITGLFLTLFSFIWFIVFFQKGSILWLLPSLLTLGWGLTFSLTSAYAAGITTVPNKMRGMATGIFGTLRNAGRSIGFAVVGAIILNVEHIFFSKDLEKSKITSSLDPTTFDGLLAKAPKAVDAFNKLSTSAQAIVKQAYFNATEKSFLIANIFAACLVVISIIWVLIRCKKKKIKCKSKS